MSQEERTYFLLIRDWKKLPKNMQTDEVKPYYNILRDKKPSLLFKRLFDIAASFVLIILLLPILMVISIIIKIEDRGPVFYRQVRITQYGREFKIFKFRTMVEEADQIGSLVTGKDDSRITKVGKTLRKYRLDEFPQLFNILIGDMTFIGTRPEVPKYVNHYTREMMATLLLPAGVTSEASIQFKDEDKYISSGVDVDKVYVEEVLPQKMSYNLEQMRDFSPGHELRLLIRTVRAVLS